MWVFCIDYSSAFFLVSICEQRNRKVLPSTSAVYTKQKDLIWHELSIDRKINQKIRPWFVLFLLVLLTPYGNNNTKFYPTRKCMYGIVGIDLRNIGRMWRELSISADYEYEYTQLVTVTVVIFLCQDHLTFIIIVIMRFHN